MKSVKPLAITMGEPHSVATYLTIKAWEEKVHPFVYLGKKELVEEVNPSIPIKSVQSAREAIEVFPHALPVFPLQNKVHGSLYCHSAKDSEAIRESIEIAVRLALKGEVAAMVTAPIQKKSLQSDGKGQTEYIAQILKAKKFAMMAMENDLRVVLVTTHVAVKEIQFTMEDVKDKIDITVEFLKNRLSVASPQVAVLGLNPHAGENGLIGHEDYKIIKPACQEAGAIGPLSADSVFQQYKKYDAIIAMYHDQGLAPFKAITKAGINITIGLPITRTSPIHGTASDLVHNLDQVDCSSFMEAVRVAYQLGASH